MRNALVSLTSLRDDGSVSRHKLQKKRCPLPIKPKQATLLTDCAHTHTHTRTHTPPHAHAHTHTRCIVTCHPSEGRHVDHSRGGSDRQRAVGEREGEPLLHPPAEEGPWQRRRHHRYCMCTMFTQVILHLNMVFYVSDGLSGGIQRGRSTSCNIGMDVHGNGDQRKYQGCLCTVVCC